MNISPQLLLQAPPSTECRYCGDTEQIEGYYDEGSWPRLDDNGDPICDDCWHDKNEFDCVRCEEYGDTVDMHRYLVVMEETDDVSPGIYCTVGTYYVDYMIGGNLYPWALSRIMDVPRDCTSDYPCGHLCYGCQLALGLIAPVRMAA